MGYLFVSYSRRQLYFAESLVLSLQRAGFDVWFDLQRLSPGVDWAASLKEGYSNCDRLILVASQFALRSPYVQLEWETAIQNGREVIVVLSEEVVLPEALRGCPVYDARVHFDKTVRSLIAYLGGKEAARHDPVPTPGKYPYSLGMPFDIRVTLAVLFLPTLLVWIATLNVPRSSVDLGLTWPAFVTSLIPADRLHMIAVYLIGFYLGINLLQTRFPLREFWRHDLSYEKLQAMRFGLLWSQFVLCLPILLFTVGMSDRSGTIPIGYLILIFPLMTLYWSFRVVGRSPDLLRWMPSGEADQDLRESVQGKLRAQAQRQTESDAAPPANTSVRFAVHHHPADAYTAEYVQSILRSEGCISVPAEQADMHLILVSNRTSKQWLLERDDSLSGQVIHILVTNIHTPPEIRPALQRQWVDLRTGRPKTLRALAAYLTNKDEARVHYGMQISPTGFDNENAFPPMVGLLIGTLSVVFVIPFVIMGILGVEERYVIALLIIPGLPLVLYVDALVMRKLSLPAFMHRVLGHRVAWFASRAPAAADAIGNTDRKYVHKLLSTIRRN